MYLVKKGFFLRKHYFEEEYGYKSYGIVIGTVLYKGDIAVYRLYSVNIAIRAKYNGMQVSRLQNLYRR